VFPTENEAADPFAPVDGFDLAAYVAVCRALVRVAGGSTRRVAEVLAQEGLSHDTWDRISATWSARIRADGDVHAEFGRLYAVTPRDARTTNE
jgi:hypothetical protein